MEYIKSQTVLMPAIGLADLYTWVEKMGVDFSTPMNGYRTFRSRNFFSTSSLPVNRIPIPPASSQASMLL